LLPFTVRVKPEEPAGTVVGDTLATTGAAALGVETVLEPPELPEQPATTVRAAKELRRKKTVVQRQAR